MEIKFYGQACFSIEDKGVTVVTDPYSDGIGLKLPALKADVVTVSQDIPTFNHVKAVSGSPRVFSWPGEYETKKVHFRTIHSFGPTINGEVSENNINLIHFNGVKLCHLGSQADKLTPEQLEQIGDVDVLFVPVGDMNGLGPKKAKSVIEQIEPRLIIPMIYQTEGNTLDLVPLSSFLSEMAASATEPVDSLKFKKSELPEDISKVMVINVSV